MTASPKRQKQPTIPERLFALDELLSSKGWHKTSPWWRQTIVDFYASKKRQLVIRAGRRAGKSSTMCKLAIVEAIWGGHRIPPGDIGVVAFVSVNRDEANQRLRTVKKLLETLGIKFKPILDGVELLDRPIAFKTYAATIAGVSGFTAVAVFADEVSKWLDSDSGRNPASEVLASIRPTMATQRKAKIYLSSSPMSTLDAHAAAFAEGDNDMQMVAFAPTWIANPTISEADTHQLEKDEGKWKREYAAIPLEDLDSGLVTSAMLDRVTRKAPMELPPEEGLRYVCAMDPATRMNGWGLIVMTRRRDETLAIRRSVVLTREWRGTRGQPLDPDRVMMEIKELVEPYGIDMIVTDQYSGDALQSIARRHSLYLLIIPTTGSNRTKLYDDMAMRIADCDVDLPPHKQLRADILSVRKRATANGITVVLGDGADGRHADLAPAFALALQTVETYGADPPLNGPAFGSPQWLALQEESRKDSRRAFWTREASERSGPFWKTHPADRWKPATKRRRGQ